MLQIYILIWHGRNSNIRKLVQVYLPFGELSNWDFGDYLTPTLSSIILRTPGHEEG